MIRTTTCPMCGNPECYLVEFEDGTKRYRCDRCDCYYVPAWLMDKNLAVLRGKNEEGKRREYVKPTTVSATDWDGVDCE